MPRKFTPKKKKTLVPEPNWDKLMKAKTEEAMVAAFRDCEAYTHQEVSEKLQIHWLKKWITQNWGMENEVKTIPDTFMLSYAKTGYKAIRLGFIPEVYRKSLENNLRPLLERAEELREKITPGSVPIVDDPEHPWHPNKVKVWLTDWRQRLAAIKNFAESKNSDQRIQYQITQNYVYNLANYLRTGIWLDSHWGPNREYKVMMVCKALAYDADGTVKRTEGVFYPDIQKVWSNKNVET